MLLVDSYGMVNLIMHGIPKAGDETLIAWEVLL